MVGVRCDYGGGRVYKDVMAAGCSDSSKSWELDDAEV